MASKFIDPKVLLAAGINPVTGLPVRVDAGSKSSIKKQLRIVDEQDAINRFTWYNLPRGLDGRMIERVLYYRGQGMFFYLNGKYYFLPYALNGTIDVYGRYLGVTPLPFNGTANDGDAENPWIQGLVFKPAYDVFLPSEFEGKSEEELRDILKETCVICKDYSEQMSQTNISRQILNDPLLDLMSDCLPFMRTALLNSTGVTGMRVATEDESQNVYAASNAINSAALGGQKYVPLVGSVDFQEMTGGNVAKAEEFLLAMQSLDNYRLSLYGLDNGGIFQKMSNKLVAEQEMNAGNVGLVMQDSLKYRQDACVLFNSYFGENMWVEASEVALGMDVTGDGIAGGSEEQQREAQEVEEDV